MSDSPVSHPLPQDAAEQIGEAYLRMAREAMYRPAAPSDGYGNITVPDDGLDLDAECRSYARAWWAEEEALQFHVGCCDFPTRPATIFAVEAARLMCGCENGVAEKLLRMALEELEKRVPV